MFVRLCVCWRIETDCFDVVTWWSTYAISDFSVHKSHPLDQQSIRLCERWEWHSVDLSVWLWQDISKGCRWIFMKFGNWKGYYLVRDRSLSSQYWDFWLGGQQLVLILPIWSKLLRKDEQFWSRGPVLWDSHKFLPEFHRTTKNFGSRMMIRNVITDVRRPGSNTCDNHFDV